VASANHIPQERLEMITSMPDSSVHEGRYEIDPLYTCVFQKGCAHVYGGDLNYFSRLLHVVGSVVLLYEPVSIPSLATLVGMSSKAILTYVRPLHSVILVPDSDSLPIRVFHKSFPDYITDHDRCKDSRFYVDSPVHHAKLAISCFELMRTGLKTNICDLPRYAMNNDIEDLSIRRAKYIGEPVVYASKFWAKHLCSASQTGDDVVKILELLRKFVQRQLLQWLEVLSIVDGLRGAIHSFIHVERWLHEVSISSFVL
jgi:hypothetical protein